MKKKTRLSVPSSSQFLNAIALVSASLRSVAPHSDCAATAIKEAPSSLTPSVAAAVCATGTELSGAWTGRGE
jgi:hypothetical protein